MDFISFFCCSLGQLASVAGIDKSDFQPLGRPQLSSTIGPRLSASALLTKGEYRDIQAKTDASSLVRVIKECRVIACANDQCSVIVPAY